MKFLSLFLIVTFSIIGNCHELKGFTVKQFQFLYQVFTGDFMDMKKKEKLEKSAVKNETSLYFGELSDFSWIFNVNFLLFRLFDLPGHLTLLLI